MAKRTKKKADEGADGDAVGDPSNGGEATVAAAVPYAVRVKIVGVVPGLLFHRYEVDSVATKAAAKRGSEAKKTDDVESYVYRDAEGYICLPGRYLVAALTDAKNGAAKYHRDPRSTRASALNIFKAGVVPLTDLARLVVRGQPVKKWDALDRRPVKLPTGTVTRYRPCFWPGWEATVDLMVLVPEYISPEFLHGVVVDAGRLTGVGDYRPTWGRFRVTGFEKLADDFDAALSSPPPPSEAEMADEAAAATLAG